MKFLKFRLKIVLFKLVVLFLFCGGWKEVIFVMGGKY